MSANPVRWQRGGGLCRWVNSSSSRFRTRRRGRERRRRSGSLDLQARTVLADAVSEGGRAGAPEARGEEERPGCVDVHIDRRERRAARFGTRSSTTGYGAALRALAVVTTPVGYGGGGRTRVAAAVTRPFSVHRDTVASADTETGFRCARDAVDVTRQSLMSSSARRAKLRTRGRKGVESMHWKR